MALEITSSAVSGLQKVAKPVEMPEQRSVERAADVSTVSTSAQIERQVATHVEQDATGGYNGNDEAQAAAAAQQNAQRIESAVKRANNTMRMTKTSCQFQYHEETNRVSIKVIDKDTEEVIREIPSEEALELIQRMWEMAGILVDEKR